MKIIHIQRDNILSGVQVVTVNEVTDESNDNTNFLICSGPGILDSFFDTDKVYHVRELERKISIFKDLLAFYKILMVLRKVRPDVVHTHSTKPGILGRLAAYVLGIKTVHTVHGYGHMAIRSSLGKRLYSLVEGALSRITTTIIVLSESDFKIARSLHSSAEVKKITNGVDTKIFRPSKKVASPKKKAIWIARVAEQKNPMLLIEAIKLLKLKNITNLHVDIWGDGPLLGKLEKEIKDNSLSPIVSLRGWASDPSSILPKYDLFISTSTYEGMPIALLEAMSSGVYPLVSKIPPHEEVLGANFDGLFDSRPHLLESKISAFLNNEFQDFDPRSLILEGYEVRRRNRKVSQLYSNICNRSASSMVKNT